MYTWIGVAAAALRRSSSSSFALLPVPVLVLWGLFMAGCRGDEQAWRPPPEPPVVASAVAHGGPPTAMSAELRAAYVAAVQAQASDAYRVQPAGTERLRASNPAQQTLSTFDAGGVRVERSGAGASERLAMRLSRYGCAGSLEPVGQPSPTAEGNRVEYRRPHAAGREPLVEWYVNGPLGLEQGFTLPRSPCGHEGGVVELELSLAGELAAAELEPGRELVFHDREGQAVLHYGELYVNDAQGHALRAELVLGAGYVTLRVHDTEAAYPVRVDPLVWTQQAKVLAADGAANDQFGFSVAISADTAVIGAKNDDDNGTDAGSAYVFVRNAGVWTQEAKLLAADGAANDYFGTSVAIHADTAVIGADNLGSGVGSAYVFVRSGNVWTEQAKLLAADGQPTDYFGNSVAISADTAVVGAHNDNTMFTAVGSVYVFVRSGNVWTQQAKLLAADGSAYDHFGYSVAVSGDTAVVGAPFDDDVFDSAGSIYVFVRSGNVWTEQVKVVDVIDGLLPFDQFGNSVAISGDTLVAGARGDGIQFADQGSAHVFVRSGNVWTQQAKLVPADAADSDFFGHSVALSGDTAVIGAYLDDDKGSNSGSAYVFVRSGNTWTQKAKLLAADGAGGDFFGESVAIDGSTAVIGADLDDDKGADSGSAYAFTTLLTTGSTCSLNFECVSGFCIDGYCCESACGGGDPGDCQACNTGQFWNGNCVPLKSGTICRAGADVCDAAEVCNGMSLLCPPDSLAPPGTVCRQGVDLCDEAESCTGLSMACPPDTLKPAGTLCRAAAGLCDEPESCTGSNVSCPVNAFKPASTLCRAAADVCDQDDNCTGFSASCPADAFKPANTLCRAATDVCDQVENCTGGSASCPVDAFKPASTLCRAATDVCDVAENCTGSSAACPADTVLPAGTLCRVDTGLCDLAETCNGLAPSCPPDLVANPTVTCRPAADICDVSDNCDGTGKDCPSNAFAPGGALCRPPLGPCDAAELCTGQSAACPADGVFAPGTECRPSAGECDPVETCDGLTTSCPQDDYLPNGAPCSGGMCLDGACELGSGGAGGTGGTGGSGTGGSGTGGSGTGGSATGGSGTGGGTGSGGVGGSGATGATGGTGGDGGPGGQAAATSGNGGNGPVDPEQEGGCNCRAAGASRSEGTSSSTLAGALLLALAAIRHKRRPRRRERLASPRVREPRRSRLLRAPASVCSRARHVSPRIRCPLLAARMRSRLQRPSPGSGTTDEDSPSGGRHRSNHRARGARSRPSGHRR